MIKKIAIVVTLTMLIMLSFFLKIYSNFFTLEEVIEVLEDNNYYEVALENTQAELNSLLPHDDVIQITKEYLTESQVKTDVLTLVESHFKKEENQVQEKFKTNLAEKLKKYGLNAKDLQILTKEAGELYVQHLFPTNELKKIEKLLFMQEKADEIFAFVLLATIIMMLIFLFMKKIMYIGNSLISSGVIFIIPKIFIVFNNFVKNFYYYNHSFSYFIRSYCDYLINLVFSIGIILVILGTIILILSAKFDNKVDLIN